MATAKRETPKPGAALKELAEGMATGRYSRTGVETCLNRRLGNTKEGTAKFVRTSKALANLKAGRPLTQSVWPTKPKAKPSSRAPKGETFTVAEVSDLVQQALANQREEFLAELRSVKAEVEAQDTPDEESETPDEEESETPEFVEGWYSVGGVEVYCHPENGWVDEEGDSVTLTLTQLRDLVPLGDVEVVSSES